MLTTYLVIALLVISVAGQRERCLSPGNQHFDPSNCLPTSQPGRFLTETELYTTLKEAAFTHPHPLLVCDLTIAMYNNLHCTNITRADAVKVFAGENHFQRSNSCPSAANSHDSTPLVGKRRRQTNQPNEADLANMIMIIEQAKSKTHDACIQWLIDCYKGMACTEFQGTTSGNEETAAPQCEPLFDPNKCDVRGQMPYSFRDLHQQLLDASKTEHMQNYVCDVVMGMHNYVHTSQHQVTRETARSVFGNASCYSFNHNTCTLNGRRRRADTPDFLPDYVPRLDTVMFKEMLDNITHDTHGSKSCIQWLIECFRDTACTSGSATPPSHPTATTTVATTKQSTAATTTTKATTTTPPATHPPTTTAAATTQLTTSGTPVRCSNCSGLECLRHQHILNCQAGEQYCYTNVFEDEAGRHITRGCMTETACERMVEENDDTCENVELEKLEDGTSCNFCCHGENCNKPPNMIPGVGRYP